MRLRARNWSRAARAMVLTTMATGFAVTSGYAQGDTRVTPAPMVTGYGAFTTTFEPGSQSVNPTVAPILLIPAGTRALVEAEFEAESDLDRSNGVWGDRTLEKGIEYLQLDYFVHPLLTVVGGRFLTPFGIYNERLHPAWIRNLMTAPFIFGLSANSSTGAMVRGGVPIGEDAVLNYATYYSAPYSSTQSTLKLLNSERSAGGRWSVFLNESRVETGFSFKRQLGNKRFDAYGGDFTWNIRATPLDLRAEFVRSGHGSGYWGEGAYRTIHVPVWSGFFRRSQFVARLEKFYAPSDAHVEMDAEALDGMASVETGHSAVPEMDTTRPMVGWNYYFSDGFKFSLGYGRSMTSDNTHKIWSIGVAYRFGS